MSARFDIGLRKYGLDRPVDDAVVVEVNQITDEAGALPARPVRCLTRIPAGGGVTQSVTVEAAGSYLITLTPPGGAPVHEARRVKLGEKQEVIFDLGRSPHEWLSLQTLTGATSLNQERASQNKLRDGRGLPQWSKSILAENKPTLMLFHQKTVDYADSEPFVEWDPVPVAHGKAIEPVQADDQYALWKLPASLFGALPSRGAPEAIQRWVAVVKTAESFAYAPLPVPWRTSYYNSQADIEVLFDAGRSIDRSPVSVAVRDPASLALLSYLGAGQTYQAAAVLQATELEQAIEARIQDKIQNPLLAAAAIYVALSTPEKALDPRAHARGQTFLRKRWRPWVTNLCNWFPWLPDGAILEARLQVMEGEIGQETIEALRRAYHRGPPYFTAGVSHLVAALYRGAAADKELRGMYERVAAYASHIDPQQPVLTYWMRTDASDVSRVVA